METSQKITKSWGNNQIPQKITIAKGKEKQ